MSTPRLSQSQRTLLLLLGLLSCTVLRSSVPVERRGGSDGTQRRRTQTGGRSRRGGRAVVQPGRGREIVRVLKQGVREEEGDQSD